MFIITGSFSVHLDANNTEVGGAEPHTSILLLPFGFCCSHLLNGVDAHYGHSVARDHTVTQVPERKCKQEWILLPGKVKTLNALNTFLKAKSL